MRERGMSTVSAVLVAAAAGLVTSVFLMDWMVVDVRTTGEDGVHLVVPFPLAAGRVATALVPDEALADVRVPPTLVERKGQVLGALRALAEIPDATLLRVEDNGETVLVAKEGEHLRIAVDATDATVRCTVPIDGLLESLEAWDWQTADPALVFDVLAAAPHGDVVRVEAEDGTRVAITMW